MGVARSPGRGGDRTGAPPGRGGDRTDPAGREVLDLVAIVAAAEPAERDGDSADLAPEDRRILGSCRQPVTVADVAAATALPLGAVRVLLADLIQRGRVTVLAHKATGEHAGTDLLKEVLQGLRTL